VDLELLVSEFYQPERADVENEIGARSTVRRRQEVDGHGLPLPGQRRHDPIDKFRKKRLATHGFPFPGNQLIVDPCDRSEVVHSEFALLVVG
jgi:hypothetical protein